MEQEIYEITNKTCALVSKGPKTTEVIEDNKTFLIQKHFALCALFLFLLTIILFAMGRVVIKMAYGEKTPEKFERAVANLSKLDITMYIPQIVLLTFAFILGIYIPKIVDITIISSLIG